LVDPTNSLTLGKRTSVKIWRSMASNIHAAQAETRLAHATSDMGWERAGTWGNLLGCSRTLMVSSTIGEIAQCRELISSGAKSADDRGQRYAVDAYPRRHDAGSVRAGTWGQTVGVCEDSHHVLRNSAFGVAGAEA
jgi:hypothetical protein